MAPTMSDMTVTCGHHLPHGTKCLANCTMSDTLSDMPLILQFNCLEAASALFDGDARNHFAVIWSSPAETVHITIHTVRTELELARRRRD